MKIADVKAHPMSMPWDQPSWTAHEITTEATLIPVEVRTEPHIHAHLVSAFGAKAFGVESHGDPDRHPIQHGMYTAGTEVRDGMVHLNDLPGLGIEIDWTVVHKHRV